MHALLEELGLERSSHDQANLVLAAVKTSQAALAKTTDKQSTELKATWLQMLGLHARIAGLEQDKRLLQATKFTITVPHILQV